MDNIIEDKNIQLLFFKIVQDASTSKDKGKTSVKNILDYAGPMMAIRALDYLESKGLVNVSNGAIVVSDHPEVVNILAGIKVPYVFTNSSSCVN